MDSKDICSNSQYNGNYRKTQFKRKEILEKKKAVGELIKAASMVKDHLTSFPLFRYYNSNGLSLYLESGSGLRLSSAVKRYIQALLKVNMEGPFGSEWPTEEKAKRREMVAPEALYIFVHESPEDETRGPMVGFAQYRFTIEEDIPVLYLYELQLEHRVQGKGLGRFLMQLIELIARRNCMGAVVLTVQKANFSALDFYKIKLGYVISSISPSRVYPLNGVQKSYEILCKTFDLEAKAILE